jgi:hypothetical protein
MIRIPTEGWMVSWTWTHVIRNVDGNVVPVLFELNGQAYALTENGGSR